jgi:hypothetical protein
LSIQYQPSRNGCQVASRSLRKGGQRMQKRMQKRFAGADNFDHFLRLILWYNCHKTLHKGLK